MSRFRCYDEHDEPANDKKNNCNDNHLPSSGANSKTHSRITANDRPNERRLDDYYRNVFNVPKECHFHFGVDVFALCVANERAKRVS